MTLPDHATRAHATHGASSCKRWWLCPGSIRLSEGIPRFSSKYADEGTAAHEVAEMCMRQGRSAEEFIGRFIAVRDNKFEVTEEMASAVQVYVDYLNGLTSAHPGGELAIEQRVDLAPLKPPAPMFGTTDAVFIDWANGLMEAIDYKHGGGELVEVEDIDEAGVNHGNKQGRYYTLATWVSLPKEKRDLIKTVRVTIVQPRAQHDDGPIRSETLTIAELKAWGKELMAAAKRTLEPDAPVFAGKHCKFCPAEAVCPAKAQEMLKLAQDEFDSLDALEATLPADIPAKLPTSVVLTPAQIGMILERADHFEAWIKSIREYAFNMLARGEPVPGWKLVAKRARRQWQDADEVADVLRLQFDLSDKEIYEPKAVRSPAQIEKLLGKAAAKDLRSYIVSVSSGPTLAHVSDKREAVLPGAGLMLEFDKLDMPD